MPSKGMKSKNVKFISEYVNLKYVIFLTMLVITYTLLSVASTPLYTTTLPTVCSTVKRNPSVHLSKS